VTCLDAQVCLSTESPKQQTAVAVERLPALTRKAKEAEPQTRTPAPTRPTRAHNATSAVRCGLPGSHARTL